MKTMMKKTVLSALMLFGATSMFAQFTMDGEFRPRTESRTGTNNALSVADEEASISTTQRTRLNFNYKTADYTMKVSVQDVRTWGSSSTLGKGANNNLDLHEAWAEVNLFEGVSLKGGRQELVYDDHRIMGSVGWAQQARSHDLGLLKYDGYLTAHIGFAYKTDAAAEGNYKSMNYIWLHKDFDMFKVSALRLDKDALVTTGARLTGSTNGISLGLNYYIQDNDDDLSASLLGLDASYKVSDAIKVGVGYESQSGADADNMAFSPVFGTNHKFNGHMDYFYVGNHGNSVGLNDMYLSLGYKFNKANLKAAYHMFSAVADMDDLDGDLGSEIDLSISYPVAKGVSFNLGHSIYNATESMVSLKGGDVDGVNNWSYFMIVIKPKFL